MQNVVPRLEDVYTNTNLGVGKVMIQLITAHLLMLHAVLLYKCESPSSGMVQDPCLYEACNLFCNTVNFLLVMLIWEL